MAGANLGQAVLDLNVNSLDYDKGFASAQGKAEGFVSRLTGTLGKIGLAAIGIKALAGAIGGLMGGMVSGNAEFERYGVQFGVLMKDAGKAKERLAALTTFAAKTPFELPEVVRADKILLAFGLTSETTAKRFGVSGDQIRTTIGDVAAGTGASFEELSGTFGKFASGATGEAIARFQEMGITTRKEMTSWGLQFSKTGQLLTPVDKAFTILEKNVRKKFGGMMDAQSQTFEGMVSNLKDWAGQTKRTLMAPLFEVLKDKLKVVLDFLGSDAGKKAVERLAQGMAKGLGKAITAVESLWRVGKLLFTGDFSGGIFGLEEDSPVIGALFRVRDGFLAIKQAVEPLGRPLLALQDAFKFLRAGDVDGAISNVSNAIYGLGDALGIDLSLFVGMWENFAEKVQIVATAIFDIGKIIGDVLGGGLTKAEGFSNILDTLAKAVLDFVGVMIREFQGKISMLGTILTEWILPLIPIVLAKLGQWAGAIWAWVQAQAPVWLAQLLVWGNQLWAWIQPQIPIVLSKLAELWASFVLWVQEQAPLLAEQLIGWANQFSTFVTPAIQGLLAALPGLIDQALDWIGVQAGPILLKLGEWAMAFIQWVIPMIPPFLVELAKIAGAILRFLAETLYTIAGKLVVWGLAFVEWVVPQLPGLLAALGRMALTLIGWMMSEMLPAIVRQLIEWGKAFLAWVGKEVLPRLPGILAGIASALWGFISSTAREAGSEAERIGRSIMEGIKEGIRSMAASLVATAKGVVGDAIGAAKNLLGIHSPSAVFAGIGENMMRGMQLGLEGGSGALLGTVRSTALASAGAASQTSNSVVNYNLNANYRNTETEMSIRQTIRMLQMADGRR